MTEFLVRYRDQPSDALTVTLIRTFKRTDPDMEHGMDMSTSGGPKDQIHNRVHAAFHDLGPEVEAISMVRGNGPVFIIARKGQQHYDVEPNGQHRIKLGREVEVIKK